MAKARRKKKIKLHEIASEPGTEAMEDFLSTEPESYKLNSLAQDICRKGRMDLLELYIAYPHHSLFGLMAGLGQAAWHNQADVIRRILSTDYDPLKDLKLNNQHVHSALEQAAIQGNDECLQLLLDAGADPNYAPDSSEYRSCDLTGKDGKTPLLQAIRSGKLSTVQALVEAGAKVNRKTQAHRRPLAVAEDLQRDDIVVYLKAQGAQHIQPSELDLEQVASRGFAARVDELLQENPPDEYDSRMLARTASRDGHLDVLKLLFKYETTDEAKNIALEPEEESLLWKMNLSGDKLGGYPCWIQNNEYPHCSDCSEKMELLLQIDSHDNLRYTWGDNGAAWLFQYAEHRDRLAFVWQCP